MHIPFFSSKRLLRYALIAPALIWVIVFMIFPLIYSLNLSFQTWQPPEPPIYVGLKNYIEMLSDERFGNALQNTSIFTIGTVATEMAIGLLVALSISRLKPRIAEKVNVVSVIPIVMTPVITGILWRMIMHGDYGILNYYLSMLGLGRYSWLSDPKLTLFSNMIVDIWHWTPFVALAFTAGISAIPREPLEAAQLDGASYWQTFKNIMLPYLRTILMLVLLLRVVEAILFFDINFILTKGGPGVRSEMVSLYVYKNAFWFWNLGYSSALSYIVLIIADIIGMALFFIVIGRKKK